VGRINQRQGFLVSAIVHLAILMTLASRPPSAPTPFEPATPPEPRRPREPAVFLPTREELRELVRPTQPTMPKPMPTSPPRSDLKDRISIGPPSDVRQKQLVLRRDEDLAMPKGTPRAAPIAPGTPPPPASTATKEARPQARATEGPLAPSPADPARPSIASSLRNLERRLEESGPQGMPTGSGRQMGPLFFDPEGADFTAWINHFKNEVYRNWTVPQPALLGFRGHVDLEFEVERDGRISNLRMLKSTGTPALDRAAQNALLGSRLMPLPADFGPERVTMQVSFFYNDRPQGS
jgi:periplasmic protein TonB